MTHAAAHPALTRELLCSLTDLASLASVEIMKHFQTALDVRQKRDASPVSDADEAAERVILDGLSQLLPEVPVLAEEMSAAEGVRAMPETFLLVDPLDGTREFISGRADFTVNIGLIVSGSPVLGVVTAPAKGRAWIGAQGLGAFAADLVPGARWDWTRASPIKTRPASVPMVAVASRSHGDAQTEAFLAAHKITERTAAGSSLKFCLLAEGLADVYPRFGPTMEWDTAAGHAVLNAAGGRVVMPDGAPFRYNKEETGFRNGAFIAWGA
jgi:3'(2'), 5'-bisphosphate nucleotidase